MKKSLITIAAAAAMVAPAVTMADTTLYGNVHLSLNAADNDVSGAKNNLTMSSNTSAIGVKGSEALGNGVKAIYKVEFGVNIANGPTTFPDGSAPGMSFTSGTPPVTTTNGGASAASNGSVGGRDQFVGLKGGMGTVKFGTFSSNYKQMGGKVDPLYRTPLEGRGFLDTQSRLHGGRGIDRGRTTNTFQYTSPKMGGIQLVANTTFSGSEDETSGVGIRWSNKNILAYVDWIDGMTTAAPASATGTTQSAVKVGGKYHTKAFSVGLQWEGAEDQTSKDYIFASGTYNINKNNAVILTAGQTSHILNNRDTTGVAVAYNHKMSKMTNLYLGYGAKSSDVNNADESMFTAGIRKKF